MKRKLALFITLALAALLLLTACSGAKFGIHKVTFDADGGDLSLFEGNALVQTYGMVELPIPTKEGYVFLGWFIGEGVNEAQFTATDLVTSDITLKAKWAKAQYTVTFVDYYGNVISRETVKHGETANAPVVPRVDEKNLRFDAWDTDISAITSDTEVKALYVVDSHTVTYVTGTSQTVPTTSYFFGEIPVLPPEPAMAGHYFIGWYLDEEFTQEYLFDAPLTSDITLYAYFNESIPIETLDELLAIPENSSNNYFLKNDIDCEGAVITTSIVGFTGVLDGCGHTIYNFVYQPAQAENVGLFATNGGTIKNLNFKDFSYSSTTNIESNVGILVGTNSGSVENIGIKNASISYTHNTTGVYKTSYFGGIAGNNSGSVNCCSVTNSTICLELSATYSGGWAATYTYAGVLVGMNSGSVANSNTNTTVTGYCYGTAKNAFTDISIGGLVSVNKGRITDSNATVNVKSTSKSAYNNLYFGGLVCNNNSTIENCFANASVECEKNFATVHIGGFVETNDKTIDNSFCTLKVTNDATSCIGGFVGRNNGGINKCYAEGDMSVGAATSGKGGFAGYNNGSINSCFADVNITATDATNYEPFVGSYGTASYVTNCYYSIKATFSVNGQPHTFENPNAEVGDPVLQFANTTFLTETLGWSADIWAFDPNQLSYPTLK